MQCPLLPAAICPSFTRLQLLPAAGDGVPGLHLSAGLDPDVFLWGRLDLRCVAAAGHRWAAPPMQAALVCSTVQRQAPHFSADMMCVFVCACGLQFRLRAALAARP